MRGTQSRFRLISADSQDEDACMCDLSHKLEGRCGPEVSDQMLYYQWFYRKPRYFACNSDKLVESQASLRNL